MIGVNAVKSLELLRDKLPVDWPGRDGLTDAVREIEAYRERVEAQATPTGLAELDGAIRDLLDVYNIEDRWYDVRDRLAGDPDGEAKVKRYGECCQILRRAITFTKDEEARNG